MLLGLFDTLGTSSKNRPNRTVPYHQEICRLKIHYTGLIQLDLPCFSDASKGKCYIWSYGTFPSTSSQKTVRDWLYTMLSLQTLMHKAAKNPLLTFTLVTLLRTPITNWMICPVKSCFPFDDFVVKGKNKKILIITRLICDCYWELFTSF